MTNYSGQGFVTMEKQQEFGIAYHEYDEFYLVATLTFNILEFKTQAFVPRWKIKHWSSQINNKIVTPEWKSGFQFILKKEKWCMIDKLHVRVLISRPFKSRT